MRRVLRRWFVYRAATASRGNKLPGSPKQARLEPVEGGLAIVAAVSTAELTPDE